MNIPKIKNTLPDPDILDDMKAIIRDFMPEINRSVKMVNNMLSDIGRGGVIVKDIIPKIFPDLQIKFQKEICPKTRKTGAQE